MDPLTYFEKFLYEAPDDDPPDAPSGDTGPPDMPDDSPPPDMDGGDPPDMNGGDPPDMGDEGSFDGMDDMGGDDQTDQANPDDQAPEGLDEKISAIMNMNLYEKYLSLLNTISNQLTMVKLNNDVLYTLSPSSIDIVPQLKKLDENIRLYLKNSFTHEAYSKNLLFFNKCLNLLKLLDNMFDKDVRGGIRDMK
jgi:hypothetical protein